MRMGGILLMLAALSVAADEHEVIHLESTFVGDKEQPSVTHIVPWKQPKTEDPDTLYRPIDGLGSEDDGPADREIQLRAMEYYRQLQIESPRSE